MKVRKPKFLRSQQLSHRFDEYIQANFFDMHQFVEWFLQQVKTA